MTTSDQDEDRIASKKMGVSGYIVKPFNLNNSSSSKDSFNLFIDLMNLKK
jgi:response regulator of citrate/malate metabolism